MEAGSRKMMNIEVFLTNLFVHSSQVICTEVVSIDRLPSKLQILFLFAIVIQVF